MLLHPRRFQAAWRARVVALDGRASRVLIWAAVALFLLGFANWATRSGLRIRREAWIYSRSIRFHDDVRNAMRWGNQVLQAARQDAAASTGGNPTQAAPGFWQIVRGEGIVYDGLVDGSGGDYGLDYPPLRLFTMTLWTRHVQASFPYLLGWPGPWRQGAQANEEIVAPLLAINAFFGWLSAVLAFFLVWLWVSRGGRRGTGARVSLLGPRRPPRRKPTPLIASAGLLLFPPLACFFFYAISVAVEPAPVPPPMVTFLGPPTISQTPDGVSATIRASINSQGSPTRWSVDWGTSPGDYSHAARGDDVGDAGTSSDVSITVPSLPSNSVVHYRITARNDQPGRGMGRGTTHTDDGILLTGLGDAQQPMPPGATYNAVWLSLWQWLGIGVLFALLAASIRWMPAEHRGWACGLLAATLMWLNPAILIDAHVWPQWDIWVLPPFLLAALLASLDWWFTAGLVFGVGTMFKGQFLIGAPILIFWPLLSMRWGALTRLLLGALLSSAIILSPWLALGNQPLSWSLPAVKWIARVAVAVVLASLLPLLRGPLVVAIRSLWGPRTEISLKRLSLLAGAIAAALIAMIALILARWPQDADLGRGIGLLLLLGVLVSPWLVRRRWLGVFAAGVLGVSIWMSAWLYHGDWSWKTVGFEYGMQKFDQIAMGQGSNGNLASILRQHFGWELHDQAFTICLPNLSRYVPAQWAGSWGLDGNPITLEVRQAFFVLFATLLTACAAGAAINDRRNSPRFLAALVAPWMLMPQALGQMMCRYQLWGAALSALLVGIAPGFALVTVLVSLLAAGMFGNQLLRFDPGRSPQLHQILSNLAPDHGWIMICMAALVLYVAVAPGPITDDRDEPATVDLAEERLGDDLNFFPADEPSAESLVGV